MNLGIVSDSHSNVNSVQRAVRLLESLGVQTVIHCGDIAGPTAVRAFEGFHMHFVFGNVDYDRDVLRAAIAEIGGVCCEEFGRLEFEARQVAFLHGDDRRKFEQEVNSGRYDLLCYGHSHRAECHRAGRTLVLNPGALHRANPHTLAVYDPKADRADILPL